MHFDKDGYLIEEQSRTDSGDTISYFYNYDEKKNLIKIKSNNIAQWDFPSNEITRNSTSTTKNTYNSKGELITTDNYRNKKLSSKIRYIYDNKGNNLEKSIYGEDGKLKNKTIYKYNGLGQNIETVRYNSNGEIRYSSQKKYDEQGNVIEYSSRGSSFGNSTCKYFYDRNNQLIKETVYYEFTEPYSTITYAYDDYGNLVKEAEFVFGTDSEQTESNFKYDYDKKNNWIKKVEYDKFFPKTVIIREITYY